MATNSNAREIEHVCVEGDGTVENGEGVLHCEDSTRWMAVHFKCFPGSHFDDHGFPEEIGPYSIDVQRLRTFRDLAWWTDHVYFGTTWGPGSNWSLVVSSAVGRVPGPLRPTDGGYRTP